MKRILIVASIVVAAARGSWAFYDQGSQVVALEGGATIHDYKVDVPQGLITASPSQMNVDQSAGSFGADYLYYLTPRLGVGVNGHYSATRFDTPLNTIFNSITPRIRSKSLVVLGVAKYSFRVEHRVMPYLLAGLGIHHTSRQMNGTPEFGSAWSDTGTHEERVLGDGSGTSVALGAGVGLDIPLGQNLFIGAEYRYEYLGSVDYPVNALGQSLGADMKGSTQLLNFAAKLGYKF